MLCFRHSYSSSVLVGAVWKAEIILWHEEIKSGPWSCTMLCSKGVWIHLANSVRHGPSGHQLLWINDFKNCNYMRGFELFNKHKHELEGHCPLCDNVFKQSRLLRSFYFLILNFLLSHSNTLREYLPCHLFCSINLSHGVHYTAFTPGIKMWSVLGVIQIRKNAC